MNKNEIIGAIGLVAGLIDAIVEQEVKKEQKKESVVGKYMVVQSSAHTISLETKARADVSGVLVEIISEPYVGKTFGLLGEVEFEVVKVRSMATNREYEVPFSESWLVEVV
jgi:hypothetical protein